jgi:hypothetical protein
MNVPMPAAVWSVSAGSNTYASGALVTQDVGIQAALSGTPIAVTPAALTLVSRSTTTVATPASTTLMPTPTFRKYIFIQAPQTADLWVNPMGGTSSIGGNDCIKIPAGGSYETLSGVWQNAITYYCATGGLALAAFEG